MRLTSSGVVVAAAVLVAACGTSSSNDGGATSTATPSTSVSPPLPSRTPTPTPTPSPTPTSTADPLPEPRAWAPSAGEVEPEVKVAATRVVEALGTVSAADGTTSVVDTAADRLRAAGADPDLAANAGALIPPGAPAVTEIVYPQYGGLTADRASVMVVSRQSWRDGARVRSRTVTTDVRVDRATDGTWAVTGVHPIEPVDAVSAPSDTVSPLLDNPALDLPSAARADLASGDIAPEVVAALTELTATYRLSVAVLSSGHPEEVFGTELTSNHTRGRAVDIWAVDGRAVVDLAPDDPLLLAFLDAGGATGSTEIGGPVDPDGPGGVHFANDLHRDHIHLGFDPA